MKVLIIIPARYGSTRFPGKPLVKIHNKTMIQRVHEIAKKVVPDVWVATDDARIEQDVKRFGGNAIITSAEHASGTDRIADALQYIPNAMKYNVVINIQGDEPYIATQQIEQLAELFLDANTQIGTLIKPITTHEELINPNKPKVVTNIANEAIYFSRHPIPYIRDADINVWHTQYAFYKHVGIYAYRPQVLQEITNLQQTPLEKKESLEQLRWIEHGYKIKTAITNIETISIDTPEDLDWVIENMK